MNVSIIVFHTKPPEDKITPYWAEVHKSCFLKEVQVDFTPIEVSMFKRGNHFKYNYWENGREVDVRGRILDIHFEYDSSTYALGVTMFIA